MMYKSVTLSQHAQRNADFLLFQLNLSLENKSIDLNLLSRDWSTPAPALQKILEIKIADLVPGGRVQSIPVSFCQPGPQSCHHLEGWPLPEQEVEEGVNAARLDH